MVTNKKNKTKLKIAVLIDVLYPYMIGGGQKRMYEIYRRLAKKHDIHFFTMKWKGMPDRVFQLDGITVHPVCDGSQLYSLGRRKVMPSVKYMLAVIPHLIRNKFDIIDCNQFPFLHIIPAKLLRKNAKLIVSWLEVWKKEYWSSYAGGSIGNFGYIIQKLCARFADKIIAISEHTKKDLVNIIGIDDKKIDVVPIGVDKNYIKETKVSKIKSDIIFVGRLIPEKNVDILLKSVKIVKEKIPKVKCLVIGEGPELEKIRKIMNKLELEDNVELMNFRSNYGEVLSLMKSSKVFASMSIREGFGIVIVEAMSCGLPVLAIEHPSSAVTELIGNAGVLKNLDPEEIGRELIKILNNKRYRESLSKHALKISEKYDWGNILNDFSLKLLS